MKSNTRYLLIKAFGKRNAGQRPERERKKEGEMFRRPGESPRKSE